jgi:hypothetical protein
MAGCAQHHIWVIQTPQNFTAMKKKIVSLCAFGLFLLTACNKSDAPGPNVYGSPCLDPDQQDMLRSKKPQKTLRMSSKNAGHTPDAGRRLGEMPHADTDYITRAPDRLPIVPDSLKPLY